MAFVSSPLPQDQQNQQSGTGVTTPNPLALLPPQATQTGGSSGQGGGTSAAPGQGTSTQFGSGASRLSDYLKANQDQVQQMANNIAGNIGGQYDQLHTGIGQAGQQFNQQVQSGYTPLDPTVNQQVQSNPVAAAANPETLSTFQKMMNSQYSGPTSFEASQPYGAIQGKVQSAVQQSDLLKTYPGLSQYLQANVERNATPGQNTLDTVLLQANRPAFQTVQQAVAPFSNLTNLLGEETARQTQGIQAAQQGAEAARQAAQQTYAGVANPFVSGLNESFTTATGKATNYNTLLNSITQKVGNNNLEALTPEERSLIGFNPEILPLIQQYSGIFPAQAAGNPLTPNQYYTQGALAQLPTPASVVTPDQIATWQALTMLGGGTGPSGLNFQMPTESIPIPGQMNGQPGELPSYNNMGLLNQIERSYGPMYQQLIDVGFTGVPKADQQKIVDYMNLLRSLGTGAQSGSQPTTPPPEPGTNGDLGAGFHWDIDTATWVPTIPNQPTNPTEPPVGGGRITH